jgi:ornithine decarboxylase
MVDRPKDVEGRRPPLDARPPFFILRLIWTLFWDFSCFFFGQPFWRIFFRARRGASALVELLRLTTPNPPSVGWFMATARVASTLFRSSRVSLPTRAVFAPSWRLVHSCALLQPQTQPHRRLDDDKDRNVGVWSCRSALVGRTQVMQHIVGLKTHVASVSVNDLGQAERQYARWVAQLPDVSCRYAVKCNPDPLLVRTLAAAGAGFDCASVAELDLVFGGKEEGVRVDPAKVILAHPIKSVPDLLCAKRHGVRKMTFDSACELQKIAAHYPDAHLVLRLLPDDSYSKMPFGSKFGAPLERVEELLLEARRLGLRVIGTSFHVGSACQDPIAYEKAIALSRHVFDLSPDMTFLDLGGGLLADATFERFSAQIKQSLRAHFPRTVARFSSLEVVAEPGRYMAAPFSTLYTCVQGKKTVSERTTTDDEPHQALFLGDGVYGSFNGIVFDHLQPVPYVDAALNNNTGASTPAATMLATLFGPTCDSGDVVCKRIRMSQVDVGGWLRFENMGAYTRAAASHFNGVPLATQVYIRSREQS